MNLPSRRGARYVRTATAPSAATRRKIPELFVNYQGFLGPKRALKVRNGRKKSQKVDKVPLKVRFGPIPILRELRP